MTTFLTNRWQPLGWLLAALLLPLSSWAQAPTLSPNFQAVVAPLYAANGTTTAARVPYVYRATLSNLTPNTLYRYNSAAGLMTAQGSQAVEAATSNGAGNPLYITVGATAAASTYVYSTSASLTTAGGYGTFTTDASGSYTGWFAFVPTGNARFTAGFTVTPLLLLATNAVPGTVVARYFLNQNFTALTYGTTAVATAGTYVQGSSSATAKNLVALYDDATGTSRPLVITPVENTSAAVAGTSTLYLTTAGAYNNVLPNVNANGVRRATQLSVIDGSLLGCQSSAAGFAGTVNPTGSTTTPVTVSTATAPLNVNNCAATPANAALTITNGTFSNTAVGSSSTATFTLNNSSGTAQSATLTTAAPFSVPATAVTVPANGSATVTVTFTPAANGTASGTLTAAVSGFLNVVSSSFSATGTASANTALTITNGTFNSTAVGSSSTATFTLNNSSGTAQSATLTTATPFSVPATAVTVPASGSVNVTVTFTPTAAGTFTGTLTAAVSGFQDLVSSAFSATGTVPAPTIAGTSANGGVLLAGIRSSVLVQGTGFLTGSGVNTATYSNGTVHSVMNVSSTFVRVDLTPLVAGNLQISNANGSSGTVALTTATPPTADLFEPFELYTTTTVSATTYNTSSYNTSPLTTPTSLDFALTSGTVTLAGTLLSNTDLSNSTSERRNNSQSARVRAGGYIEFVRPTGVGTLNFLAGFYGTDNVAQPNTTFTVTYSTDGGQNYSAPVAGAPAAGSLPLALTPYSFVINQGGTVRVRIANTIAYAGSNVARFNVDDVQISNFVSDLTVSAPGQPVSGTYNSVTITGTGSATLTGPLTVNTALTVQNGGSLATNCQAINGAGTFTVADGATLSICDAAGISASGAVGAVQTTGARSFSTNASYVYNGTVAQTTGSGLPATVRNLTLNNTAGLALSQPVGVAQVLALSSGALSTGGQLTLLSAASGTALVSRPGTASVNGSVTVQRYIDPSQNAGLGYRHYASPVASTTFSDLSTGGFAVELSQAAVYNNSATPGLVTPFPNVFGYDESRVLTATNNFSAFNKGWFAPTATTMQQGRGYTANIAASEKVDFTGALSFADANQTLSRAASADAGWHLLGNPYAAPLDLSTVTIPAGINSAVYVYHSTSQYGGQYRSYVNGVGNPVVPVAQGFFVRATTNGAVFPLSFANTKSTFSLADNTFQRGAADQRPTIQLTVSDAANTLTDDTYVYAEAGASTGFDAAFDAEKLPNTSGLSLASSAGSQPLAINGLPVLSTAIGLPLTLEVPATGTYLFTASILRNLPAGTVATLRDALTGTRTVLTAGTTYRFTLAGRSAGPRFTLELNPAGTTLASATQQLAARVQLYPNPAAGRFHLTLPAAKAVQATLVNALGQVVLSRAVAGNEADFEVAQAGVYTLRLVMDGSIVVRKVVVE